MNNSKLKSTVLSLSLVTGMLLGTNVYTLYNYHNVTKDYVHKYQEENELRREVEKMNSKLIKKNDELVNGYEVQLDQITELKNKADTYYLENESLKKQVSEKDDRINSLEKQLNIKKSKVSVSSKSSVNVKGNANENKSKQVAKSSGLGEGRTLTMTATAYTANCKGCSGITATGVNVKNTTHHQGKRVVAVDPSVIKLGTTLKVESDHMGTFYAIAADKGGKIKNHKLDILVSNRTKAINFGRQSVKVTILN